MAHTPHRTADPASPDRMHRTRPGRRQGHAATRSVAFAWAVQNFHIATETLGGHRDFSATSCPGANLYTYLTSGDLKRPIDELLAAGTVDLQRVCGQEAAAVDAAIEAGS